MKNTGRLTPRLLAQLELVAQDAPGRFFDADSTARERIMASALSQALDRSADETPRRPRHESHSGRAPFVKTHRGRPPKSTTHFSPSLLGAKCEVAVPADRAQRQMVDESGELDRRMQLTAPDVARIRRPVKRAIKSWFDVMPADADGVLEGRVYRLHLSARERERRVRSMRDLVDVIGVG